METRREELLGLLELGRAVAVKGMGGSGKTTLADLIYHCDYAKARFEHRAWITVSEFGRGVDVLQEIMAKLSIARCGRQDSDTNIVNEFLRSNSYLIVLDDAWDAGLLREIRSAFPMSTAVAGGLILTTRIGGVASDFARSCGGRVYELEPLSEEDSWDLLCKKAFPGSPPPSGKLAEICRGILRRCEGLPLAIAAAGGVLAMKDGASIDQFDRVYRCLAEELRGRPEQLERIFSLGYDDLPDELKACLLYLSVFPQEDILKSRLIQLWVAENFIPRRSGSPSTLEEIGEDCFNELLNRGLIQPSEKRADGSVWSCRVHDVVRDFLIRKASDEHFAAAAAGHGRDDFPERVRRLAVHRTADNVPPQWRRGSFELRSLLLFHVAKLGPGFVSELVKGSPLLQVLDLSRAPIGSFPEGITRLYNLRYLSLNGTGVKLIPSSVAKLRNLLTLNLKDTQVEELPEEILGVSSLRHVCVHRRIRHGPSEVFEEIRGFKGMKGIGALSSLQSLCNVEAVQGCPDMWRSIGELTQLRRLGLLGLIREDGVGLCSSIGNMTRLLTLELQSRDGNEILSLESLLSTPWCLQRLRIAGRLERLPHWIPKLSGLQFLVLRFSGLRADPLEYLQTLSNLVELKLYGAYDGEELCFGAECFPVLKVLEIKNSGRLRTMRFEAEAVPCLEKLVLEQCKMLKELPLGIERLSKLQRLELIDMDAELARRVRRRDCKDKDCSKVMHVPSIEISSRLSEDGADENLNQYMSNRRSDRATNIIQNHDFSKGLESWRVNSCDGLRALTDQPDGRYAVVTNRTRSWHGLEQGITGKISRGSLYFISAFVGVSGPLEGTSKVDATLRLEYEDRDPDYVNVGSIVVSDQSWEELKGTIVYSKRPKSVMFYLEGPSPGIDLRIRSVVLEESEIIKNPRFEDALNNWSGRGCEIFESNSMGYGGYITPFSGTSFACTRNRKNYWNGIDQNITGKVTRKLVYEVTAVVRVFSTSDATKSNVIATVYVRTTDGHEDYIEVAKVQATDAEWKKLQGKFLLNSKAKEVVVYVEGPPPEIDILLDSLVIKHAENVLPATPPIIEDPGYGVNIIENSDLNDGTKGWFGLGNCSLRAEDYSYDGLADPKARFVSSTNRTEHWMGPAQMITDKLKLFFTYQVSARVKTGYCSQGPQRVCVKLEVVNRDEEDNKKTSWVEAGEVELEANDGGGGDNWHEITGSFRLEKQPSRVMIYVFGPDPGIELKVAGLQVFPVDRAARFEYLKQKTDEIRKRDVVLKFSGLDSISSPITAVKVRQTRNSFPFGSRLYRSNLDNEDFVGFFQNNFNWAAFARELKWGHTERQKGKLNYKDAGKMFDFCRKNHIKVRGHCIFRELDDPKWVRSLSKRKLSKAVEDRLKGFITHCRGKVEHYDVINEMLSGSFYRDGLGGDKAVAEVFKKAKRLDPDALLFMNESIVDTRCSTERSPERYIQQIKDLRERHNESTGALIGGVGVHGHQRSPVGPVMCTALDKLGSAGLPVWYTELRVYSADERVRADDLEVAIREAFAHPAVGGIVLWEFWEVFRQDRKENVSHLVSAEGEVNEAGQRFLALRREFLTSEAGNVDEGGEFKFRGFPGDYSVEIVTASETFSGTFDVGEGKSPPEKTILIKDMTKNVFDP